MRNTIERIIQEIFEKYQANTNGAVADYIPELALVDHDSFGIVIVTTDGKTYSFGDCDVPFTIQSISKAFTYGYILDQFGYEQVEQRIGVEPSGEAFNSISLEPETGRPRNPMINAGAIAASGMVDGKGFEERFEKIRSYFSLCAGSELGVDEAVYRSESSTGFRNRAIANLLRNYDKLEDPVDEAVEVYFRQCSILVTCQQLGIMAGSLANDGINPITGKRVIAAENLDRQLSVMSTCGMYDASGEWIFNVGLPAKSGVGGGVLGVLPGQLGVAVFSPRLDEKGNSVRGVQVFRDLSKTFNLHLFNAPVIGDQAIRRVYHMSEVGSNRQRRQSDHDKIREKGDRVAVIELQGDLFFAVFERMQRRFDELDSSIDALVIDLSRVGLSDVWTRNLFAKFAESVGESGKRMWVIDPENVLPTADFDDLPMQVVDDPQDALEAEEQLILGDVETDEIPFASFELFSEIDSEILADLESKAEKISYTSGQKIVSEGGEPDHVYLLASGLVSVAREGMRLHGFCPGVVFGDLAIIDHSRRSADVVADGDAVCYAISADLIQTLKETNPTSHSSLIMNLLKMNVDRLRRTNAKFSAMKN